MKISRYFWPYLKLSGEGLAVDVNRGTLEEVYLSENQRAGGGLFGLVRNLSTDFYLNLYYHF